MEVGGGPAGHMCAMTCCCMHTLRRAGGCMPHVVRVSAVQNTVWGGLQKITKTYHLGGGLIPHHIGRIWGGLQKQKSSLLVCS